MEPARLTDDFTRRITTADGNNIVTVLDVNAANSEYQIFQQDYLVNFQVALEDLKVTVGLFSLAEAPWPETNALMSEAQKMAEIAKVRTQGQKISLQLYTAKGNGPWVYQSKVVLQNQGNEESHVPILVPFLSSNETLLVGGDFKLGARIEPIWNQPLKANDYLVLKGTYKQVVTFSKKKDDDLERLSARIEALELALDGKLTSLPANSILGRGNTAGTAQPITIIPDSMIASTISRDSEVNNAILAWAANSCQLTARSGGTVSFNANDWQPTSFAALKWLDGGATNQGVPVNSGMLFQFDSLFGTSIANKYRVQQFNVANRWWDRYENNGTWLTWRERAYL